MLVLIHQIVTGKFTFYVRQRVEEDEQQTATELSVSPLLVTLKQKHPMIWTLQMSVLYLHSH